MVLFCTGTALPSSCEYRGGEEVRAPWPGDALFQPSLCAGSTHHLCGGVLWEASSDHHVLPGGLHPDLNGRDGGPSEESLPL